MKLLPALRKLGGRVNDLLSPVPLAPAPNEVRAAAAPPSNVAQSLARILRPQAAYRWLLPQVAAITPQYIEMVLRGALAGNHVQQWELFDLMFDTWPELGACAAELCDGVLAKKPTFHAWRDEDEEPTPGANEKMKLCSAALRTMQPNAAADENDFSGTIKDIADGWFRGVTALEVEWGSVEDPTRFHMIEGGAFDGSIAPRATFWVHPTCFAWDANGVLGLRTDAQRAAGQTLSVQPQPYALDAFPENKFLVCIHKAKSGTALGGALLRPLAWWWCAANFSADWLLNLAQVFGLPFRWANYDPNAPQATIDAICAMLQNMGSAGWAAFPAGTTLELKDSGKTGDHSPQGELLDRADRYARMVILGQTMSGSQNASKGGGKAFGAVEGEVKAQRIEAACNYVCAVLNSQLIPSIVSLNYGDASECPQFCLETETEEDLQIKATIIQTLTTAGAGSIIGKDWLGKTFNIPKPNEDEETLEKAQPEPAGATDLLNQESRKAGTAALPNEAAKPGAAPQPNEKPQTPPNEAEAAKAKAALQILGSIHALQSDADFQTALKAFAQTL